MAEDENLAEWDVAALRALAEVVASICGEGEVSLGFVGQQAASLEKCVFSAAFSQAVRARLSSSQEFSELRRSFYLSNFLKDHPLARPFRCPCYTAYRARYTPLRGTAGC
jgi:hypothetical protein